MTAELAFFPAVRVLEIAQQVFGIIAADTCPATLCHCLGGLGDLFHRGNLGNPTPLLLRAHEVPRVAGANGAFWKMLMSHPCEFTGWLIADSIEFSVFE